MNKNLMELTKKHQNAVEVWKSELEKMGEDYQNTIKEQQAQIDANLKMKKEYTAKFEAE